MFIGSLSSVTHKASGTVVAKVPLRAAEKHPGGKTYFCFLLITQIVHAVLRNRAH